MILRGPEKKGFTCPLQVWWCMWWTSDIKAFLEYRRKPELKLQQPSRASSALRYFAHSLKKRLSHGRGSFFFLKLRESTWTPTASVACGVGRVRILSKNLEWWASINPNAFTALLARDEIYILNSRRRILVESGNRLSSTTCQCAASWYSGSDPT